MMKLFGVKDKTHFIASIGHYDYVQYGDLMADGGQPGCTDYAGYTRHWGETCYAEVPQTFSELYTDYRTKTSRERQYGIWPLKEVRILQKKQYPSPDDWSWIVCNAVWGTRGKNGDEKLKYIHLADADTEHLEAILNTHGFGLHPTTVKIIKYILEARKCE